VEQAFLSATKVLLPQVDAETCAAGYSASTFLESELDERFGENIHDIVKPHEERGSDSIIR
jgi:hypothetical protein